MRLAGVTITGADHGVDPQALTDLSGEFPFVEWGILFSTTRQGQPRYPNKHWLDGLARRSGGMWFAAHLCGRMARDMVAGDDSFLEWGHWLERVQLNGVLGTDALARVASRNATTEFILQAPNLHALNDAADFYNRKDHPGNVSALWDPSGGLGVRQDVWPMPRNGLPMGYAGGIGPDNVGKVIGDLTAFDSDSEFWIDMESGVRTDGRFDLTKVREVLSIARSARAREGE